MEKRRLLQRIWNQWGVTSCGNVVSFPLLIILTEGCYNFKQSKRQGVSKQEKFDKEVYTQTG